MSQQIIHGFPLSPQQKHLWLLQSDNYSQPRQALTAFLLEGDLNLETLETALNRVVNRHEILRTTFNCLPGMTVPVQVIYDRLSVAINQYDFSHLASEKQKLELEALFQQQTDNEGQEQILPVALVTLSPNKYLLVIALSALCTDTKSLKNLLAEIGQTYAACTDGRELADEPIQYILVSQWQNELLKAEEAEIGRDYWRKQDIARFLPLQLPFELQSARNSVFKPQILNFSLDPSLVNQIDAKGQKYGFCESTFLLTCWYILLYRLIGNSDLAVAISCDGRPDEELDKALGLFAKYLPINSDLDSELKFNTFLEQIQLAQQEAYEWQECFSWEDVLAANENVQYPLFFPFGFDFEAESSSLVTNELSLSVYKQYACCDRFKVKLSVLRRHDELLLEFHYDANLFTVEDIATLAARLPILLASAIANPETPLGKLEILSPQERHQLLIEFNQTQVDYPQNKCLHQLFEEQVQRTPDAIAVVFEEQHLTYRELNNRANQLAYYLQSFGVGADVLVGICLERSLLMVVSLLAVLKAGGAYVPLDPSYPRDRLALMVSDAQAPILLTEQKLLTSLPENQAQILCLDTDWELIAREKEDNLINTLIPENLAYTIYTSGSTGKPKGVTISHRAICNHMFWMQDTFPLAETDKVLQKTPFSFDASVWEFYAPLLVGGQLILARPGGHQDTSYLIETISKQEVTILQLVPSLLRMLLEASGLENCNSLKRVFCGGEALPVNLQDQFLTTVEAELHNLYGPTEACIDATVWTCQGNIAAKTIPIGRPIANTQIYILDSYSQPVPMGVVGELHIGGAGLANGYLNRRDLTAKKFIPNPFKDIRGVEVGEKQITSERLYKTGDLARYLPNGNIEYLGRIDHQVKIRGFRIELGEIEAALSQHSDISEAVVVVREHATGDYRLVAYIVPVQKPLSARMLQNFLEDQLPDYMIPSSLLMLDSLPLAANGKVDRRALPAPDWSDDVLALDFVSPRDTLELQLTQIWETVLNVRPIGIRDNFFTLGGHSLLAVRLMAQIQQQFQKHLPLATLFESPTIAQLAELLRQETDGMAWSSLVPIQPHGSQLPFFCVPGSGGNTIYLHDLARYLAPERPFYGLQAVGLDGKSKPHTTIEEMAAHYIKLIQTVQPHGPYLLGGHSLGGQVAFEMAQQLQQQEEEVALLAIFDTFAPIASNKIVSQNWDSATWLIHLTGVVERLFDKKLVLSQEILQDLNPEEQLNYFKQQLELVNLLPPGSGIDQVRGLVEVFKANHQIQYQSRSIYPSQITLFRANELPRQETDLEKPNWMIKDPSWGWENLAVKPIEIHTIPGNHFTIMKEPHVQILAEKLIAAIAKVQMEVAA